MASAFSFVFVIEFPETEQVVIEHNFIDVKGKSTNLLFYISIMELFVAFFFKFNL